MGQALYRTYRSKKLSELVGQEHITTALEHALKKGTISHAYLFTGPKGTGKTSIARILAHEINGIPYEDDTTHLDIIEIDAASNRRIDEIRDLRDKVHIAPTSAKYKVYIIDEVHMLTKEAFNALLKTLEEPPQHVVFILATTEAHKLPETIISRTQRFTFKPIDMAKVVGHLKHIAKQEKLTITDEALDLIAKHGEGSFRDSIGLLDQMRNAGDSITLDDVQHVLGIAPAELIEQLLNQIASGDTVSVAASLEQMHAQGYEPAQAAKQLGQALRSQILGKSTGLPTTVAMTLFGKLINVPSSSDPRSYLEIALLDAALATTPPITSPQRTMPEQVQANPVQVEPHPSSFRKTGATKIEHQPVAPTEELPTTTALDDSIWPKVLDSIKQKHNTLYSVVRATTPQFTPGKVTLVCDYAFHQKRLNETKNKQVVADTIQSVTGQVLAVQCSVRETEAKPVAKKSTPVHKDKTVENISNIFGGAELLDS